MITETNKNLKRHTLLSTLTLTVGVLLMAFKIYADSEPGALPLLLILVGATWYFVTRARLKKLDLKK